ncbi:MAG: hypothetical protein MI919_07530 [Holophagales bacterium]|nr:hypothetical protein [Holophagales bacterium]
MGTEPASVGLLLYGPSVIFEDGAAELEAILEAAIDRLSSLSGIVIREWGTWTLSDEHGQPMTEPEPYLARFEVEGVIGLLSRLAGMARQVRGDPSLYILHIGI